MGIDISRLGPGAQKQLLQKLKQQEKPSKYGNVKEQRGAITFDSKKEAGRFDELMAMQKAGLIRNLKLQHEFTLQAAYTTAEGERIRAIRYLADFSYERLKSARCVSGGETATDEFDAWVPVVEDVKSRATKTATYRMKRKLMQERFGLDVEEI